MKHRFVFLFVLILSISAVHAQVEFNDPPEMKKGGGKKGGEGGGQKNKQGKNGNISVTNGNIVMGSPTSNSITASVILQTGSTAFIEYSTKSGVYNKKTSSISANSDAPVEYIIDKLEPATTYYYRLHVMNAAGKEVSVSLESWFATQKKKSDVFSFGVQGDSHPERVGKMFSSVLYKKTLDSVGFYKPDFYFMMGDDFNIDRLLQNNTVNQPNVEASYKLQRSYLGNAGSNPPLFLVNGNHEQAAKYLLDGTNLNAAVLAGNARKKYFPLPAPEKIYSGDKDTVQHVGLLKDYYAFEWGDALFVVIDPYWHSNIAVDHTPGEQQNKGGGGQSGIGSEKQQKGKGGEKGGQAKKDQWGITLGDEQYQWFRQTLEKSKATYKFVFSHHVLGSGRGGVERAGLFEWGGKGQNGSSQFSKNRPAWELPIHQLMVKNKVTIFFQGHDHIFAKQELDGVIYQSVPNPADDTHTAFNKEAYTSGVILPNSGFLNVTVGSKGVKVDYIRTYLNDKSTYPDEVTSTYSYTIK